MASAYGLLFALGFLCAYALTRYCIHRYVPSISKKIPLGIVVFILVASGFIGGRAVFVVYNLPYFLEYPSEIPAIWHGGWVWHGAFLGGLIALILYARAKKLSWLLLADFFSPGVALAQSIGRWGNYFNQELYGKPSDVPWAIAIDPLNRVAGYEEFARFHPTFLYESLWDLLIFIALLLLFRRITMRALNIIPGLLFSVYLIAYSSGRFFIEFFRIDPVPVFASLRAPQWWSIALACFGILILLQRQKKVVYSGNTSAR
jgi:phosphatidylglycerol:prolipoprotein diacylglycerol transferase